MSQGDCPKHGRWYGICHCCHKENEEREDRKSRKRLYDENEELRVKLAKAEKVIEAAGKMRFKNRFDCTYVEANDWETFRDSLEEYREGGYEV